MTDAGRRGARSKCSRSTATATARRSTVSASDVWGKLGRRRRRQRVPDRRLSDRRARPSAAPVDNNAAVDFRNVNVKLQYDPTDRHPGHVPGRLFPRGTRQRQGQHDRRHRRSQRHDLDDGQRRRAHRGCRTRAPCRSTCSATSRRSAATSSRCPAATPPRSIGRMTLNQRVPTNAIGGHRAVVARRRRAASSSPPAPTGAGSTATARRTGSTRRPARRSRCSASRAARSAASASSSRTSCTPAAGLMVTLSARRGSLAQLRRPQPRDSRAERHADGEQRADRCPDRDDTVASPRVAARYHFTNWVSVWGDFGWGFRAPTLNELYRQFRVGTVLTLANNQLGPERLVGGEAGVSVEPVRNLTWRTTWFDNRVKDPVSNVTLTTVGANVTQQRQNLGRTRITGVQTDVEYRIGAGWRRRRRVPVQPRAGDRVRCQSGLVGKYLPQVPRAPRVGAGRIREPALRERRVRAAGGRRCSSTTTRTRRARVLPGFAVLSLSASRRVTRNLEVFAGVQNLTDREYFVGTLPTTIGTPRLSTAGSGCASRRATAEVRNDLSTVQPGCSTSSAYRLHLSLTASPGDRACRLPRP